MQIKAFLSFALFGCALAAQSGKATIESVMQNLDETMVQFDRVVRAYNGPADNKALLASGEKLDNYMSNAIRRVSNAGSVGMFDLLSLQAPVQRMAETTQKLISDMSAKKPTFQEAGMVPTVTAGIKAQREKTLKLTDVLMEKMPARIQAQGPAASQKVRAAFDKFMRTYQQ